ncbi:hypothetical protein KCU85_g23, partial [Aureobasidium melanogenum]
MTRTMLRGANLGISALYGQSQFSDATPRGLKTSEDRRCLFKSQASVALASILPSSSLPEQVILNIIIQL